MPTYSPEQLEELYKALPKELQDALFSEKNAQNIQEICVKRGVTDEDKIFDAVKNVGYVLLGLLPPNEFPKVLEEELELESHLAKEIAGEIKRFVFYPVRQTLEALYKTEMEFGQEPPSGVSSPEKPKETKKTKRKDIYREPIE